MFRVQQLGLVSIRIDCRTFGLLIQNHVMVTVRVRIV